VPDTSCLTVVEQIKNIALGGRLNRRRGKLLSVLVSFRNVKPSFDSWEIPIKCVPTNRVAGI
jgi:hypothetical protein